LRPGVR